MVLHHHVPALNNKVNFINTVGDSYGTPPPRACTEQLGQLSVADPDPGSGAFLPPGSGIRIRDEVFPDPRGMFFVRFS
jgi:hypothetical protein